MVSMTFWLLLITEVWFLFLGKLYFLKKIEQKLQRAPMEPPRFDFNNERIFHCPVGEKNRKERLILFSTRMEEAVGIVSRWLLILGSLEGFYVLQAGTLSLSRGVFFGPNLVPGWTFLLLWFPEGIFSSLLAAILLGFRFPDLLSPNGSFLVIDGTTCKIKFLSLKISPFPWQELLQFAKRSFPDTEVTEGQRKEQINH